MTERSYVLPSETPDDQANRQAALTVMRGFKGDIEGMWTALEMVGLDEAAEELIRARALSRDLSPAEVPSRQGRQPEPVESPVEPLDGFTAAPKARWCKCDPTKHDLNDPAAAVTKSNGRKECRVALNRRRRAKKARRAAERGTA